MKNTTKNLRSTAICLITAAAIALPNAGHAGWFSDKKAEVTRTVKAAPGNARDKMSDIADKLNEMHTQMKDSRPLTNALKNGNMIKQLAKVVEFLNESQQDFQDFADNGADVLKQDINNLVDTISAITDAVGMDSKMTDQLHKAAGMVDKMPTTFLFAMAKGGIDTKLQEIADRLDQLSNDLVLIATLPQEKDAFLYPESYMGELCPLVNEKKLQVAILNARLDTNIWMIDNLSSLMPEDLTVSVTVVGGGGATLTKFPPQYLFKAMKIIIETIQLRVKNYTSIAGSMCEA